MCIGHILPYCFFQICFCAKLTVFIKILSSHNGALISGLQLPCCTECLSFARENAHYFPFWLVSFYVGTTLVLSLCIISLTGTFKLVCPFTVNIFIFYDDIVRTGGFVKDRTQRQNSVWFLKYDYKHFMYQCWQQIKRAIVLKNQKWYVLSCRPLQLWKNILPSTWVKMLCFKFEFHK